MPTNKPLRAANGHQANCLADRGLPQKPFLELTELYTFVLYGHAKDAEEFSQEINAERRRNRSAWNNPDGPEWLVAHLKWMLELNSSERIEKVRRVFGPFEHAIRNKLNARINPDQSLDRFSTKEKRVIGLAHEDFGFPREMSARQAADQVLTRINAVAWIEKQRISPRAAYDRVQAEIEKHRREIELSDQFKQLLYLTAGQKDIILLDGAKKAIPSTFFASQVHFWAGESTLFVLDEDSRCEEAYEGVLIGRRDAQRLLDELLTFRASGRSGSAINGVSVPRAAAPSGRGKSAVRMRGPGAPQTKRPAVRARMKKDIREKRFTAETLKSMKPVALAATYGVNRETASKALQEVLEERPAIELATIPGH